MINRAFCLVVLLLLVITSVTLAQDEPDPRYQPAETCFIPLETDVPFECGFVTVPEFHDQDTGNTITLPVIRLLSASDNPEAPLFFGAGGPGGSVLAWSDAAANDITNRPDGSYADLISTRDLVFFGQRGTLLADPYLTCPEAEEATSRSNLSFDETLRLELDAIQTCYDRFVDEGVNFDAFDSVQNAADVNLIREIFGYDQIVYYGESYGTILGQHIMRDFPDILESVILDGTTSLSITSWEQDAIRGFQNILERVVALCDADATCAENFPNFAENLDIAYDRAVTDPLTVTVGQDDILITPVVLSSVLRTNLYVETSIPQFPRVLQDLAAGRTDSFFSFYSLATQAGSDTGFMMHYAVVCGEDPVTSFDDVTPLDYEPFGIVTEHAVDGVAAYSAICNLFDVPLLPDETDANVTNDLPVLVLTGGLDVATPDFRAEEVAAALPNSTYVLFPNGTHVQARPFTNCATDIMVQFISDPATELDTSCVDTIEPIVFANPTPTIEDVIGLTFNATGIFVTEAEEFLEVPEDATYTIAFMEGGEAAIVADCNTVAATYTSQPDGSLSIELGASTLVACPEGSVADTYLGVLGSATSVRVLGGDGVFTVSIITADDSFVNVTNFE